ncbi:hypothetical protein LWI29_015268 [Acer saccharum]|uniref:Retrotransposon gag domain-containing protein n=1 Tax=Acer saccharum TaxID=4024 RepID=A0AA39VNC6_ACESA|nr:hypothetical protein LWI29_015268 [Acer saccharum]
MGRGKFEHAGKRFGNSKTMGENSHSTKVAVVGTRKGKEDVLPDSQPTALEEPGSRKEMVTDKNPMGMGQIEVGDAGKEASVSVHVHGETIFGGHEKVVDVISTQVDSNLMITFPYGKEVDKVISGGGPSTDLLCVGPSTDPLCVGSGKYVESGPLVLNKSVERDFKGSLGAGPFVRVITGPNFKKSLKAKAGSWKRAARKKSKGLSSESSKMANAASDSSAESQNSGNPTASSQSMMPHLAGNTGPQATLSGMPMPTQASSVKLDRENFLLWKNMVMPIIRSYKLEGYILGTKICPPQFIQNDKSEKDPNPEYDTWVFQDQFLLWWLYQAMTLGIASQVMGKPSTKVLWDALVELYGVQSRSRENYYRQMLQQTRKGSMKMDEYLNTMKKYADHMALAGAPVTMRDLVPQITSGLDDEYTPAVLMVESKPDLSWVELQGMLLTYENRLEQLTSLKNASLNQASANFASTKGGNFGQKQQGQSFGQGRGHYFSQNNNRGGGRSRGRNGRNNNSRPTCQVCGKIGHSAAVCYYRFDNHYMGSPPSDQNKNSSACCYP